jgi:hypothetical protein
MTICEVCNNITPKDSIKNLLVMVNKKPSSTIRACPKCQEKLSKK